MFQEVMLMFLFAGEDGAMMGFLLNREFGVVMGQLFGQW